MTHAAALTQANTKLVIEPVVHESHGRVTRRTWRAAVTLRDDEAARQNCGHLEHPTVDAARKCGLRVWRRLPGVARKVEA